MRNRSFDFLRKRTYTIANAVGFGLLWLFFFFAMHQVLDFWEKNQLFRYTAEYFRYFDHEPLGVLFYLNTFFIQFNYHLWLGAAVYAGLFWLIAFLLNKTLSHASQKTVFAPGWITAALLLPTIANSGLLWALILLLVLIGAWCWQPCKKPFFRYLLQTIVVAALVWAMREYTLLACLFYIGIDIAATVSQGKKIKHYTFWPCWIGLLPSFAIGWILWQPYAFLNFNNLFSLKYEQIPFYFFDTPTLVSYCYTIGLLFFVSTGFLLPIFKNSRKTCRILAVSIGAMLLLAGTYITFSCSEPMRHFQKVDTLCRQDRWEEALHQLNRRWEQKPDITKSSFQNRIFAAQTKTALLATRTATQSLFTYPQPTFPMLFPWDIYNNVESFVLPIYYLYAGGFAACLHATYDLITTHYISLNSLRNVITASAILNDTMQVAKMAHLLENTLFYRREAAIYRNAEGRNRLPAVLRGKTMIPPKNYAVVTYEPDNNALVEYKNNPDNPYFYEYTLAVLLVMKQHKLLLAKLPDIILFYQQEDRAGIPRHIQEALLANFGYVPMRMAYPPQIEGVSRETWRDYWHFLSDMQARPNPRIAFEELQEKWGHTYWFYDNYLMIVDADNNNRRLVN